MLTNEEKQEIEALLTESYDRRSASVEAMKIVQVHRGYVSDEALYDLAPLLDMTTDELDGLATFYNLLFRQPVGKHVLMVCDSVSCWIMGGESLLGYLEKKLNIKSGQTTADGQFTLLPIVCLGHCEQAPALMLDNTIIGNVTPGLLDRIIESGGEITT